MQINFNRSYIVFSPIFYLCMVKCMDLTKHKFVMSAAPRFWFCWHPFRIDQEKANSGLCLLHLNSSLPKLSLFFKSKATYKILYDQCVHSPGIQLHLSHAYLWKWSVRIRISKGVVCFSLHYHASTKYIHIQPEEAEVFKKIKVLTI